MIPYKVGDTISNGANTFYVCKVVKIPLLTTLHMYHISINNLDGSYHGSYEANIFRDHGYKVIKSKNKSHPLTKIFK